MKTEELKKIINCEDSELKIAAIKEIGAEKNMDQVFNILPMLEDQNGGVREALKAVLVENGHPDLFKRLFPYLESISPETRNLTVEILYSLVDLDLSSIRELLFHENENLVIYGCQILGYSKDKKAIHFLRSALNNKYVNVRNSAASSLENTSLAFDPNFILSAIKTEEEIWVKFALLETLNKKGNDSCIEGLQDLIENESELVVIEVIKIYEKFGDLSSLNYLTAKSYDSNSPLQQHFNKCILNIIRKSEDPAKISNDADTISYLKNIIDDGSDTWCTYEALNILGELEDSGLCSIFEDKINSDYPLIRIASINALSKFNDANSNKIIEGYLKDADPEVKKAAEKALTK